MSGFLLFKLSFPAFKQQHFQKQERVCLAFVGDCYNVSNLLPRSFLFGNKRYPGNEVVFLRSQRITHNGCGCDTFVSRPGLFAKSTPNQRRYLHGSTTFLRRVYRAVFFPHGWTPFFRWMLYESSFSALMSLFS